MKYIPILIIAIMAFTSCGKSEYQKQLEADISGYELQIETVKSTLEIYEHRLDSMMNNLEDKTSDELTATQYLLQKVEQTRHKIRDLEMKKHELELELLKDNR